MTLRLLHVCQPTDGGAAVVAAHLARVGVAQGFAVTVAAPAGAYLSRWVTDAGAEWIEIPMTREPSFRDVKSLIGLRRLMSHSDVVHLHSSKAGALGRLLSVTMRRHRPGIVFTPHGWSWYVGGRAAKVYRVFERWASSKTDVVTVVSAAEQAEGRTVLAAATNIRLIRNGVDTERYRPGTQAGADGRAPLIVQVGRLSRQKAQDRSIRALARLGDERTQLRLVGAGPDERSLRGLAEELGLTSRIEFVGSTDPRAHLSSAEVVWLPSRWEGMSLALLEALSSGCAIVASDCGGIEALEGCGIVVPHEDDEAAISGLVTATDRLIEDSTFRRGLGQKARERALAHFDHSDVAREYIELWRRLA